MWRPLEYRFASDLSGKSAWEFLKNSFRYRREFNYITWWIKHPDPGSKFEKHIRLLKWLPGTLLFWLLIRGKYEGALFYENNRPIGHAFWYKKSPTDWRMFSISTTKEVRGLNYGRDITRSFLLIAYEHKIRDLMFSAGGTEADQRTGGEEFATKMWVEATNVQNPLELPFNVERGRLTGLMHLLYSEAA